MSDLTSSPYPGLRPFRTDEDYLFFGREEQTTELVKLLREHRFLAVVGRSGSGKSSLVRAGVLPAIHGGMMQHASSAWEIALLRPGGHLLYSVCTFTAAETDAVAHNFLATHPGFKQEDFRTLLPSEWLELTTDKGCVRTLPHRHDGMDAFFAARFVKS